MFALKSEYKKLLEEKRKLIDKVKAQESIIRKQERAIKMMQRVHMRARSEQSKETFKVKG